jgi:hypothetical protein
MAYFMHLSLIKYKRNAAGWYLLTCWFFLKLANSQSTSAHIIKTVINVGDSLAVAQICHDELLRIIGIKFQKSDEMTVIVFDTLAT